MQEEYTLIKLKDPTKWSSKLLLFLGTMLALCITKCAGSYNTNTAIGIDLFAGVKHNVTCLAHDAKFLCDCHNENQHMLLPHLKGSVFQVEIINCKSLTIEANSLAETEGLRKINFKNIEKLVLKQYALAIPRYASSTPLIIEFEKVNFELIDSHAINGVIEELIFHGGRIDLMNPFGFSTLKESAILLKMDGVWIKKIETQAFKKFAVDQMEITNCIFENNLPSKAFYELEVNSLLVISNVRFHGVHTRAFWFKTVRKLTIINNNFENIDAEWIEARVFETVIINQNNFGETSEIAFKAIAIHDDYANSERLELRFLNNTVRFATEPKALTFNPRFTLNIKLLQYDNNYVCKDVNIEVTPPQPKTEFFRKYSESLYFRSGIQNGAKDDHQTSFLVLSKIIETDCKPQSYLLYILIGVISLVIIIIIIVIIVWLQCAKRRKLRKMDMVLPEPRTYKETQIVYQIENAGLLKTDL